MSLTCSRSFPRGEASGGLHLLCSYIYTRIYIYIYIYICLYAIIAVFTVNNCDLVCLSSLTRNFVITLVISHLIPLFPVRGGGLGEGHSMVALVTLCQIAVTGSEYRFF